MFGKDPKIEDVKLKEIKNRLLDDMLKDKPGTPEFIKLLVQLERVSALQKSEDKPRPDMNTICIVGGNLLGILIIVAYEQKHVFASTAKSFVLKTKT